MVGIPQESRDLFRMLEKARVVKPELSKKLQAMVGFRNLAVHEYQDLNLEIVRSIIENRMTDFQDFTAIAIKSLKEE